MQTDVAVPKLNVHTAEYTALPEYGGSETILCSSPDGTRSRAVSRLRPRAHRPHDESADDVAAGVAVTVHRGEHHEMGLSTPSTYGGGMTVDFELHDVTLLMSSRSAPRPYGVGRPLHGLPAGLIGRTLLAGVCLAGVMGSG